MINIALMSVIQYLFFIDNLTNFMKWIILKIYVFREKKKQFYSNVGIYKL